jgi:hypothetical protein
MVQEAVRRKVVAPEPVLEPARQTALVPVRVLQIAVVPEFEQ